MPITPPRAPPELLTITQLCRLSGATPRALRYYEQLGLLSPAREGQSRIYSRREQVRLMLILKGRRVGLRLSQIQDLFEIFEKQGPHAQVARALPLLRAQLAVLERKFGETDDTIKVLNAASVRMAAGLQATSADSPDQSRAERSSGVMHAPRVSQLLDGAKT